MLSVHQAIDTLIHSPMVKFRCTVHKIDSVYILCHNLEYLLALDVHQLLNFCRRVAHSSRLAICTIRREDWTNMVEHGAEMQSKCGLKFIMRIYVD